MKTRMTIDEHMKDDVKVTVIATGFDIPVADFLVPSMKTAAVNKLEPVAAGVQEKENVSFYRKGRLETPNPNYAMEEKDDLDIPTFKRKM